MPVLQICLGQSCTSLGSFFHLATGSEHNTVQNQLASKTHRRRLCLWSVARWSWKPGSPNPPLPNRLSVLGPKLALQCIKRPWHNSGYSRGHQGCPLCNYQTFLLLCAWQLWKNRHDVLFREQEPSLLWLLLNCKEEARLWSCRLPRQDKNVAEAWCSIFCSNM